jgi:hypothetical protein
MRKVLAMYEPAADMPDFFNEIGVPMECCTDPMPVDQMPSPERIAAVLKKHTMEVLEAWHGLVSAAQRAAANCDAFSTPCWRTSSRRSFGGGGSHLTVSPPQ